MINCGNKAVLGPHTHMTVADVRECFNGPSVPLSFRREAKPEPTQIELVEFVPSGRYAFTNGDGEFEFYQVDIPERGKWKDYIFISRLAGAPGSFVQHPIRSGTVRAGILKSICKTGIETSARLFGHKHGVCGKCMSPLTDVRSRAAGYGPVCARKSGFWYPSEEDALKFLAEGPYAGSK